MRMNGNIAIGIGIATRIGGNSVKMGELVRGRLEELETMLPVGIELNGIYFEDEVAVEANNAFIINLILAVSIVIIIILLAMGVRAGILIGSSLIFTIMGTLLFMMPAGIELHRTSLAAIIIAMGMLVDNAVVVMENIFRFVDEKDMDPRTASIEATREIGFAVMASTPSAIARQMYSSWKQSRVVTITTSGFCSATILSKSSAA